MYIIISDRVTTNVVATVRKVFREVIGVPRPNRLVVHTTKKEDEEGMTISY